LNVRYGLVEVAKKWKGHEGCDFTKTSDDGLLKLISDAVDYDRKIITELLADKTEARLNRLEKTLGTLISWSMIQLGSDGQKQLLDILEGRTK